MHFRFAGWGAAGDLPSEQAFEADDELGCAPGSSGRFGAAQVAEVLLRVPLQQFPACTW